MVFKDKQIKPMKQLPVQFTETVSNQQSHRVYHRDAM